MSKAILTFALTDAAGSTRRVQVRREIVKIGRDDKSHLRLSGEGAARMHAVIEVAGPEDVTLIDLGNEPGTIVNGARIDKCRLYAGDTIQIGDTRLVLERAEAPTEFDVREPSSAALRHAEPASPFSAFAAEPLWAPAVVVPEERAETGYRLLKSGPAVNPEEIELADVQAAEVMVSWGHSVLGVAHLSPPRDFYVGEDQGPNLACDVFLPSERLGTARMPLLLVESGTMYAVIPAGARGTIELAGQGALSLDQARERGEPCAALSGAHRIALPAKARARIELGDFVFTVANVAAGKPVRHGLSAGLDSSAIAYFGLSALVHASVISALAFFVPGLGFTDDEALDRSRTDLMMQYLRASAERNREQSPDAPASDVPKDQESGTGARAQGSEGSMGNATAKATNERYGIAGPTDNQDVHVARERALAEARNFGILGLLNAGLAGDPNAPTAPWGRDTTLGRDEVSAMGLMFGAEIGEAFGAGGLGLTGIGEGGGGRGEGIGLGLDGIGHGAGLGDGQGFGRGVGRLTGKYVPKPRAGIRTAQTIVSGRLPAEIIQRIVRQNYGRFRMCYTAGLGKNPNLEGRVAARFVIGRDGAVSNVSNGGSDIPDSSVVQCVLSAFYGLTFPQPENGIVTVVYPILFSPG